MGRTALNVNGAITAGMLTRRWLRPKTEKHGAVEPAV
jgi:L-cystine uptake protein TcyP (sodium:dicarboxylate symporter family)